MTLIPGIHFPTNREEPVSLPFLFPGTAPVPGGVEATAIR
jgi:hypothetical protein